MYCFCFKSAVSWLQLKTILLIIHRTLIMLLCWWKYQPKTQRIGLLVNKKSGAKQNYLDIYGKRDRRHWTSTFAARNLLASSVYVAGSASISTSAFRRENFIRQPFASKPCTKRALRDTPRPEWRALSLCSKTSIILFASAVILSRQVEEDEGTRSQTEGAPAYHHSFNTGHPNNHLWNELSCTKNFIRTVTYPTYCLRTHFWTNSFLLFKINRII